MTEKISCATHGSSDRAFVCHHVLSGVRLGFFFADDPGNPRPDAWCGLCEEKRQETGEWNDESEAFAQVKMICAGCYDAAKQRNSTRRFTFKCASCEETHDGVPGFSWDYPIHYLDIPEAEREQRCVLTADTCVINQEWFFVKANLEIPVLDAPEPLVFGVWVSLSEFNFRRYESLEGSSERVDEPPMFAWFSTPLKGYPDTDGLKSQIWLRAPGTLPYVELEPTDHPLAVDQRSGITVARLVSIYEAISPGAFTAV